MTTTTPNHRGGQRGRLMYALISSRITYHGGLPLTAPLACDVADAAGVLHRAEYVPDSMLEYGHARYTIDGATYELQRNGVLRPVANEERRAA